MLGREIATNIRVLALLGVVGIAGVIGTVSCNGLPEGSVIGDDDYSLQAYLLGDIERDTSLIRVNFRRGVSEIPGGPVSLDTVLLDFDLSDSLFKQEFGPANALGSGAKELTAFDGSASVTTQDIIMVGGLGVQVANPVNKLYTSSGGAVVVNLTSASVNSSGYVLGIVRAGEEYTGVGWAQFVSQITNTGTIPPEYFRDSLNNDSLLVGTYYVYMYSYNGAPQVDDLTTDLPTVLPEGGFTPNLSVGNLTGSIGSIVVSARDTLVVTDTP